MDTGSIATNEVYQAIIQLKYRKTGDLDQITAEHLEFARVYVISNPVACY